MCWKTVVWHLRNYGGKPTEIKSALLPEEKHISGVCYFTVKKFQSLSYMLLQRGRVFPNAVSVREQTLPGMKQ